MTKCQDATINSCIVSPEPHGQTDYRFLPEKNIPAIYSRIYILPCWVERYHCCHFEAYRAYVYAIHFLYVCIASCLVYDISCLFVNANYLQRCLWDVLWHIFCIFAWLHGYMDAQEVEMKRMGLTLCHWVSWALRNVMRRE